MAVPKPPVTDIFANTVAGTPSDLWDVPSYLDSGFPAPSGVPVVPPLGYFNWLFWFASIGVRYIVSNGIVPWNSVETQYTAGTTVQDTDGNFYVCRGTATTGTHPSADPTNWFPMNVLDRGFTGQYTTPIAAWRNFLGNRAALVDHQGFFGGRVLSIDENWLPTLPNNVTTRGNGIFPPNSNWAYLLHGASAGQSVTMDGGGSDSSLIARPWGTLLRLATGGASGGGTAAIEAQGPLFRMAQAAFSISFDFAVSSLGGGAPAGSSSFAFGLSDGSIQSNVSDAVFNGGGSAPQPIGVAIYAQGNGNPWVNYVNVTGTPVTAITSTLLATDVIHRVRWDILGNASADNGTVNVITYIDGAIAVASPGVSFSGQLFHPFFRMSSSANDLNSLCIGPLQIRSRLYSGDVGY
jgi:hypothetical protein